MKYAIKVWPGDWTYNARILAPGGYKATCTSGPDQAAAAVARKWYGNKVSVRRLDSKEERRHLAACQIKYAKKILSEATHVMEGA